MKRSGATVAFCWNCDRDFGPARGRDSNGPLNRPLPELDFEVGQSVRPSLARRGRVQDPPLLRLGDRPLKVDVPGETAFQSGGSSWSGRLAGSEAGVLPASLLAVAGAGGAGGAWRLREARTISAVLPTRTSTPPRNSPIASQSRNDSLAPRSMSATTGREPSAFMTTTESRER